MTIKSISYQDDLLLALADPMEAAHYINAAIEDSPNSFLMALRDVAQAKQMAKVAKEAGIQRETIYRSLSAKGNPTWDTLSSLLDALGLTFNTIPKGCVSAPVMPPPMVSLTPPARPQTEQDPFAGYAKDEPKFHYDQVEVTPTVAEANSSLTPDMAHLMTITAMPKHGGFLNQFAFATP